jgi:multidrug efflux pump
VFSQIGMILLIGLMAKNGILVVEFANQLRDRGLSIRDAVLEASVVRLRPILMTSIATVSAPCRWPWRAAPARKPGGDRRGDRGRRDAVHLPDALRGAGALLLLARYTKPIGAIAARLNELEKRAPTPHPAPAE